ncbi:NAD-dependent epimerase/dehydratase family protein [Halobacillus yeomjeoni]|uniref:NAD-dependent epimerase/dehydratase family protein n=1 Tax=Halobacillus yeomjeoni TaxID=311194 RepID=UPI001CD792C1|nr:NAD-dependent epimerase/dehydratase family protein [Halobacillus yeomjeoni]MCA0985187.1 NAD-dependent epimerase/dehydratase family protein [Halobacillus yeomjeoni]
MKKILITGKNSYVGNSLKKWLINHSNRYEIHTLSLRCESWKEEDFSIYDVVFHVAGIAHVSSDPRMEEEYYRVNRDLTINVAKKAKDDGVAQFIFMSSIIVYGDSSFNEMVIDHNTVPNPSNYYGKSKLQAEEGIKSLEDKDYNIVIIRPPMIYGKGSKGNYPKLASVARKVPLFPNVENKRSMLHIDNLTELIRILIDREDCGMFFPQNEEYVNTSEMVRLIAEAHGKRIRLTKVFNPVLKILGLKVEIINKVFGNLIYEKSMSEYKVNYQIRNLQKTIELTEK